MKLYYYQDEVGNFGDDLNPWLWDRLLPGLLDDDPRELLVGIGSLLNPRVPAEPRKLVFSSGYGYGAKPDLDESWRFYCVRGPLTARELGLDPDLAVCDGAILVATVVDGERRGTHPVSYMPHHASTFNADWPAICRELGFHYLDPGAPVDETLAGIKDSQLVVTEALHGAIVADALRVPWIPVRCYDHIFNFKWMDWLASLGMTHAPQAIPEIWGNYPGMATGLKAKNGLKRGLWRLGLWRRGWGKPPATPSTPAQRQAALGVLARVARETRPSLSDPHRLGEALDRMQACLERLKRDLRTASAPLGGR